MRVILGVDPGIRGEAALIALYGAKLLFNQIPPQAENRRRQPALFRFRTSNNEPAI